MTILAFGALLYGCATEARHRVLSTVFDGVPPPGTAPKPRLRRGRPVIARVEPPAPSPGPLDLAGPNVEEEEETERAMPHYESYAEVLAKFPTDEQGNVDWAKAARQGLVAPRPSLDPEAEAPPTFPLDIRIDSAVPGFDVVFPHAAHTYWLGCSNCHQEIFLMKAGANPMSMTRIFEGEACGRCHGKVAFAPATGCARCHPRLGGPSS